MVVARVGFHSFTDTLSYMNDLEQTRINIEFYRVVQVKSYYRTDAENKDLIIRFSAYLVYESFILPELNELTEPA